MKLAYSDSATQDLDDIYAYIAVDSPRHANRMIERLEEACGGLTAFPSKGRLGQGGAPAWPRANSLPSSRT